MVRLIFEIAVLVVCCMIITSGDNSDSRRRHQQNNQRTASSQRNRNNENTDDDEVVPVQVVVVGDNDNDDLNDRTADNTDDSDSDNNNRNNDYDNRRRNNENDENQGSTRATGCSDLAGFWYNPHGSELYLKVEPGGQLSGEYRTNVEAKPGAAGTRFSTVGGVVTGKLVSFSVAWHGGESVTAWSGQCYSACDQNTRGRGNTAGGGTVLETTWILTSKEEQCSDHWRTTRIGHDMFTRQAPSVGPRKRLGTDVPAGGRY